MKKLFLVIAGFSLVAACSTSKKNTPVTATPMAHDAELNQGPVSLTIISPRPNEVVKTKDVPITFDLKNYEVKPDGQHIHVILDNEAYLPCYSIAEPFVLKNVKPGIHTIRAFPARAWHESIKDPTAFAAVTFFVEHKKGKAPVDFSKDPLLTYSRPKGKYEGSKAEKILFDFWVKNAQIGSDDFKVRYKLDNDDYKTLTEWKPHYLENLPVGNHKLVIELLGKNGKPVRGKYNKTEREFEVAK